MQETIHYTDLRWPELKSSAEKGTILLLPLGQVEEHGPHLPVGCDYHIASRTAEAVAKAASKEFPVLMLPALWCGYSGKDLFNWPGVISLPPEMVIGMIEHICLSLSRSGFKKLVVMNAHGHHVGICRVAARKVADQCDMCVILTDVWKMANDVMTRVRESELGGCCHAGEYETSLQLYFGHRVDMATARDERVISHSKLVSGDNFGPGSRIFWSTWRYQKSETGTYGCPTVATAEKGEVIFNETVKAYVELLREFHAAR